jgi:hypothetical protein
VEHCFGVIKRVFGFNKVRYRGAWPRTPTAPSAQRRWPTCSCFDTGSPERCVHSRPFEGQGRLFLPLNGLCKPIQSMNHHSIVLQPEFARLCKRSLEGTTIQYPKTGVRLLNSDQVHGAGMVGERTLVLSDLAVWPAPQLGLPFELLSCSDASAHVMA